MGRKITDPQEIEALFRLLNRMADGYEATEEEAAELEEIIEIERWLSKSYRYSISHSGPGSEREKRENLLLDFYAKNILTSGQKNATL